MQSDRNPAIEEKTLRKTTQYNVYDDFIDCAGRIVEEQRPDTFYVILYLDITGFQLVNDFYGIEEGDRFLAALESYLMTFSYTKLCRRVFSDHYLYLGEMPASMDCTSFREEYEQKLRAFRDRERIYHSSCRLHIVGGSCRVKGGKYGLLTAIDDANIARKKAKEIRRTEIVCFDEAMEEQIGKAKKMEIEIQEALQNESFTFYLQPKVNLRSGKIVGAEALARWVKADGTVIAPGAFIDVMEKNQTLPQLDFLIYRQVCQFLRRLLDANRPAIPISVNMSRLHIFDSNTAEKIHELVQEYKIPPYLLEFELTESMLMEDFSVAKRIMISLRSYGYKTSIDDYGSGYSGVMVFRELTFDVLKLDSSFINTKDDKEVRNDAIIRSVVPLAEEMQITVLCEGVETRDECLHMKNLGCKIAQGYSFSKPLAVPEFEQMFRERDGYFELPWENQGEGSVFAPEHINIEILPESQIRSITQSFVHIMPYGIAGFDEKTRKILFATQSFFELIGYTREELIKMHQGNWDDCLQVTYTTSVEKEEIQNRFDHGQNLHMEYYLLKKDQSQTYVSMDCGRVASPEWGSYVLCSFFDQTEQKAVEVQVGEYQRQVEQEREHADLRMQTAIDMLDLSINEYDFNTEMMHMSPQNHSIGRNLLGKTDLSLKEFMEAGLIHPDYRDAYLDLYKKMETEDEVYLEYLYQSSEDGYHWVSFNAKVAIRDHGRPVSYIGVTRLIENQVSEEITQEVGLDRPGMGALIHDKWSNWKRPLLICFFFLTAMCGLIITIFVHFRQDLETEFQHMSNVANLMQENQWIEHTHAILRETTQSAVLLISTTILMGLIVFYFYMLQKRKLSMVGDQYAVLSEFSDTVLFQYYYHTDILEMTPNATERFQVSALQKENYLKEQESILSIHPHDWMLLKEALENSLPESSIRSIKTRIKDKSGQYLWCSIQIRYLYVKQELEMAVGKITDINSQKELEERLIRRANIDSLTQLYNKSTVEHKIAELLKPGRCGFLIMMDMDNFKQINDTYGHVIGDKALLDLGQILRDTFRAGDAVGRIGGDEFIAYLSSLDQRVTVEKRLDQIFEQLAVLSKESGPEITLSMGIASYPQNGSTYQELYRAADEAMYQAKKNGKNSYCFKS